VTADFAEKRKNLPFFKLTRKLISSVAIKLLGVAFNQSDALLGLQRLPALHFQSSWTRKGAQRQYTDKCTVAKEQ